MLHEYLKAENNSVLVILANTEFNDKIGCEYLYVHPSAKDITVISSPFGENFSVDVSTYKKPTPSDYVGTIEIKRCLTLP